MANRIKSWRNRRLRTRESEALKSEISILWRERNQTEMVHEDCVYPNETVIVWRPHFLILFRQKGNVGNWSNVTQGCGFLSTRVIAALFSVFLFIINNFLSLMYLRLKRVWIRFSCL